jgi:aspartate/glutamate racemase
LNWAQEHIPALKKVGLVSSTGTLISGLFHDTFKKAGIEVFGPTEEEQEKVMDAIFGEKGIKAGFTSGYSKETIRGYPRSVHRADEDRCVSQHYRSRIRDKAKKGTAYLIHFREFGGQYT